MKPYSPTPLDQWTAKRIGLPPGSALTSDVLRQHQCRHLEATLALCRRQSLHYRPLLADSTLSELVAGNGLTRLPFTDPQHIQRSPLHFLCVSQSDVARAVTLQTSGTTAASKRVFFTTSDLEQTIDFFHYGMASLAVPGQRALVLLPGPTPASVGDLLCEALARMDVQGLLLAPLTEPALILKTIVDQRIDCIVGTPIQLIRLVRHRESIQIKQGRIKSILLSTDYVPRTLAAAIAQRWGCRIYQHYGMTEMGYGGAVDCSARQGYHLREADLLFEIVDPLTGQPVPDGTPGEVVFTTLTRRAMPLLRYRTGDLASILTGPCPCGSVLKRMEHVRGRLTNTITLPDGRRLELAQLDEIVFATPSVINYRAEIRRSGRLDQLHLTVYSIDDKPRRRETGLGLALEKYPVIHAAVASGVLELKPVQWQPAANAPSPLAKRQLLDLRKEPSPHE